MKLEEYERIRKVKTFYRLLTAVIVCLILTPLVITGCNQELSYEDLVKQTDKAMASLVSYRMELTGTMNENEETNEMGAVMEYVAPDRLRTIQDYPEPTESMIIGKTIYGLDIESGYWSAREWPGNSVGEAMGNGFVSLISKLIDVKKLEDEKIDGIFCYHYTGTKDLITEAEEKKNALDINDPDYKERLKIIGLTGEQKHTVEFWIGKKDYYLRQITQEQEYINTYSRDDESIFRQTIVSTFRLYDFNADIIIEKPQSDAIR